MSLRDQNYFITKTLGEGGFGQVSTVFDDNGQRFAMKVFECEENEDDDEQEYDGYSDDDNGENNCPDNNAGDAGDEAWNFSLKRKSGERTELMVLDLGTLREISVLRLFSRIHASDTNVEHPGIMKIHDTSFHNGLIAMIMPVFSMNLTNAINAKCLKMKQKMNITYTLLSTLAFLHSNHIIHRDIKCDNILLDDEMNPVLTDFSLANIFDARLTTVTHEAGCGTATYKAPEVYYEKGYGLAADVFSLGVAFLELFNGVLQVDRDKAALLHVEAVVSKLSDKPVPALLKSMLMNDPQARGKPLDLLALPLFADCVPLSVDPSKCVHQCVVRATGGLHGAKENAYFGRAVELGNGQKKNKKKEKAAEKKKTAAGKKQKRSNNNNKTEEVEVEATMAAKKLEIMNPLTEQAAIKYARASKQSMEYCMYLAAKVYEYEIPSFEDMPCYFEDWNTFDYAAAELAIFKAMDYCIFV